MIFKEDEIFLVSDDGEVTSKVVSNEDPDNNSDDSTSNVLTEYGDLFSNVKIDDDNIDEEEIDDIQDKQKPDTQSNKSSSSTLNLQALTIALRDSGYLPNATDDDLKDLNSAEKFAALLEKEIRSNEYNDLPDDVAESLKALRNGASWEEIVAFKKQEVQNNAYTKEQLEGDDDSAVEARKAILTQYYKRTTNFSDSKINTLIQRAIDTGADEQEALDSLKELQELDKKVLADFNKKQADEAKAKKEAQAEKVKQLKETIAKTNEFIPGIKFNEKQKDSLYKSIVEPVDKLPNGAPINAFTKAFNTDENFRMKVHALAVLTKDFTDFSVLETKAKRNAIQEFDKKLNQRTVSIQDNSPYDRNEKADSSLLEFISTNY